MTLDEAMQELRSKPVVDLWPTVGVLLGLSRGSVYQAAHRGDVDVLRVGRLLKAKSVPLLRKLGQEAAQ
jgi:hypothetical protein